MGDEEKILFANEAFYAAFATADMHAMDALWARDHPVSVVHPGAMVTLGRAEVMDSWASILGDAKSFDIAFRAPIARLQGAAALVLCYERVGAHSLIATNVFVREEESWLMVHHQSGPSPLLPDSDDGLDKPVH